MAATGSTFRLTNLLRVVRQADPDYERDKRTEWEYDFRNESGRVFKGITAKRGPYESPPSGFLKGSYVGVTNLPGD